MGMVIYRRVQNVYDIPNDILIECIGRGLAVNRGSPQPLLEVMAGHGLRFDPDGTLTVTTGHGLRMGPDCSIQVNPGGGMGVDECGRLRISPGRGLLLDEANLLIVNTGNGLDVDDTGRLEVTIGPGLRLNPDGLIVPDNTPEPLRQSVHTFLADANLSLDAQNLKLTKTYTVYLVTRDSCGRIIDLVVHGSYTRCDEVMLGVCYGYGYGDTSLIPMRPSGPPTFYKK